MKFSSKFVLRSLSLLQVTPWFFVEVIFRYFKAVKQFFLLNYLQNMTFFLTLYCPDTALMYVILPVPLILFAGADTSIYYTESENR